MYLYESIFLVIALSIIVGIVPYFLYRQRETKKPSNNYSSVRVIKLTGVFLAAILYTAVLGFLSLYGVLSFSINYINTSSIIIVIASIISMGAVIYGAGMYSTTLILEYFTPSRLKQSSGFNKQILASKILHGPLSHILMNSGLILFLFLMAVLADLRHIPSNHSFTFTFTLLGMVLGVFTAMSQIINGTVIYQAITSTATFAAFIVIETYYDLRFANSASIFYFYTAITISVVSWLVIIFGKSINRKNVWYQPINIAELRQFIFGGKKV